MNYHNYHKSFKYEIFLNVKKRLIGFFDRINFDGVFSGLYQQEAQSHCEIFRNLLRKKLHRGEAELCNTFCPVSRDQKQESQIKGPRETIKNRIGDVIDTYKFTTPAVNRTLIRKNRIETSTDHSASY